MTSIFSTSILSVKFFNMPRVASACLAAACGKRVVEGIECDACFKWAHPKCSGIKPENYTLYDKNLGLQWICTGCVELLRKTLEELRASEVSQAKRPHDGDLRSQTPASSRLYSEVASTSPITNEPKAQAKGQQRKGVKKLQKVPQLAPKKQMAPPTSPPQMRGNQLKTESLSAGEPVRGFELNLLESRIRDLGAQLEAFRRQESCPLNHQKTVLILNHEEPEVKESKSRRDMDRRRVLDVIRMSGLPNAKLRRVHRVGVWKRSSLDGPKQARPILVEFFEPATRNILLANSDRIFFLTNGRFKVVPDVSRTNRPPTGNKPKFVEHMRAWKGIPRTTPLASTGHVAGIPQTAHCRMSPVVIIEDVLEDEEWKSCIQVEPQQDGHRVMLGVNPKENATNPTPLRQTSTPARAESKLGFTIESILGTPADVPKNGLSPRVLRPRNREV